MAGIYIHIPFCKQRCKYCSFFSSTHSAEKEKYVETLCRELELRQGYLANAGIDTIYIGGGTPSTLSERHFREIFKSINTFFSVATDAEITLEANPDDISAEYATMLRSLPFNRLSMGVQSFDNKLLKRLGRRHDAERAISAFHNARNAGFDNISMDLMFALPGSTTESWTGDLRKMLELHPEHISAYNLTYEEGTPLFHAAQEGTITPLGEEENLEQFTSLVDTLTAAGYRHYEISNFALPGRESRHNSSYWHDIPYLGCGAAAHSYNGNSRQWNVADISLYIKGINDGEPDYEIENLTETERYNDAILTRLRTYDGLPLKWFRNKFSEKYNSYMLKTAEEHISRGTLMHGDNDTLRLTRKGIFISDAIIRDLIFID